MAIIRYIFVIITVCSFVFAQNETPPPGSEPKDFNLPEKSTFTLENGLRATKVHYGSVPKVTVKIKILSLINI
jgi:hypothetical protein